MSASLAVEPPFGGIAPLPLMALVVSTSRPCARRGAPAAAGAAAAAGLAVARFAIAACAEATAALAASPPPSVLAVEVEVGCGVAGFGSSNFAPPFFALLTKGR